MCHAHLCPSGLSAMAMTLQIYTKYFISLLKYVKEFHVGYKTLPVKVPGAVVCAAIAGRELLAAN